MSKPKKRDRICTQTQRLVTLCDICHGTGRRPENGNECPYCRGTGRLQHEIIHHTYPFVGEVF